MEKNKFTHGSLFSGIGGSEIAAEIMGWKNMFHCEINPFGRKILDYWFPNSKSYEDITKTDFTEWRGKINVLTGGFPCQPFSCAGQRKGAEDDRYLWPEMLRAIREIQPDWVVGENVAGILSMVQPGSETALGREESLFGEVTEKEYCIGRNMSSKQCVTTLNVKDIPSNRLLFRLVPSERRTGETGCGSSQNELLPTVQTQGLKRCNENGKTEFYPVKLLPTPYCGDASGGARKLAEDRKTCVQGKGYSARLNDLMKAGVLPTPAARDYQPSVSPQALKRKNGKMRTDALCNLPVMLGEHHSQNGGKTSQLNPLFVAEMMGFPPDWTVLPFQSGGRNR